MGAIVVECALMGEGTRVGLSVCVCEFLAITHMRSGGGGWLFAGCRSVRQSLPFTCRSVGRSVLCARHICQALRYWLGI